jgi:hypothetical protein
VLTGLLWCAPAGEAASTPRSHGQIEGRVSGVTGIPQMGATVLLLDRYDRLIQKVLTDDKGNFRFQTLVPDTYAVRVTLASFLPALRRGITLQPGMRSFLAINLTSVFSSIELFYPATSESPIMSEDWKWVLRSSSATRPVLRVLPGTWDERTPTPGSHSTALFSDTRGVFALSAGDRGPASVYGNQADLGTAFAVATSLLGSTHLIFSGNLGYASHTGASATGFRTSFSRDMGGTAPEVTLTMRQVFLPGRALGAVFGGQEEAAPALRTASVTFMDRFELSEVLRLEYGFSLDSVSYLDRLNYASPFARLSYKVGENDSVEAAYHSGVPPAELFTRATGSHAEMRQGLAAVAFFPRVSLRGGRVQVQRAENLELAYHKVSGSRRFSVGAYREAISNGALMMSAPEEIVGWDLMPDLGSRSSIFNIGGYSSIGYTASVTQVIAPHLNTTLSYGNGGVLTADSSAMRNDSPDDLRAMIRSSRRHWVAARLSGELPGSHTYFSTSYRLTDYRALTPGHLWITQNTYPDIGLNILLRQPIPNFPGVPGKWEATADLRNMLAQGYLPVNTPNGRRLLLIQTPRTFRGGFNFIF